MHRTQRSVFTLRDGIQSPVEFERHEDGGTDLFLGRHL